MRQHSLTTVATIEIYKLFLLLVNITAKILYSVSTHTRFKSRIRNMQFGFNKKKEKYEDIVEVEKEWRLWRLWMLRRRQDVSKV